MSNKVFETYKELPSWAKGIVVVGGLVVVYVFGSSLYKKIFPSQSQIDAKQELDSSTKDLQKKLDIGIVPTYNDSQYIDWANQIASSLSGCLASITAYSTIRDIFSKLKNDADFLNLKLAYGTRTIPRGFICGGDIQDKTMSQAIRVEFDSWEINGTLGGVALIGLNPTLEANGITYRI